MVRMIYRHALLLTETVGHLKHKLISHNRSAIDSSTGRAFGISPWDSVQMQTAGIYFTSGAPNYTTVTGNVLVCPLDYFSV